MATFSLVRLQGLTVSPRQEASPHPTEPVQTGDRGGSHRDLPDGPRVPCSSPGPSAAPMSGVASPVVLFHLELALPATPPRPSKCDFLTSAGAPNALPCSPRPPTWGYSALPTPPSSPHSSGPTFPRLLTAPLPPRPQPLLGLPTTPDSSPHQLLLGLCTGCSCPEPGESHLITAPGPSILGTPGSACPVTVSSISFQAPHAATLSCLPVLEHLHTCTLTHLHTHTHMHTPQVHTQACTLMHVHAHTCTHVCVHSHTCLHKFSHPYTFSVTLAES